MGYDYYPCEIEKAKPYIISNKLTSMDRLQNTNQGMCLRAINLYTKESIGHLKFFMSRLYGIDKRVFKVLDIEQIDKLINKLQELKEWKCYDTKNN